MHTHPLPSRTLNLQPPDLCHPLLDPACLPHQGLCKQHALSMVACASPPPDDEFCSLLLSDCWAAHHSEERANTDTPGVEVWEHAVLGGMFMYELLTCTTKVAPITPDTAPT